MATKDDSKAMPPPPVPPANKSDTKILQPEFEALAQCLKHAIVKTGQIYSFYAEVQKLGVTNHVPNPPQTLTASLGRDIERYDQLCDSIEAQLHRAISVLKRDLQREEQKKQEEERRKAAASAKSQPTTDAMSEDMGVQPSDSENSHPRSSPSITTTLLARRPSTVSISSLQRPQLPFKLDLSSASLRITEEEAAMYQKDLGSPVTLAPKSARPNDFPPDLMAAFSSTPIQSDLVHGPPVIDLTISNGIHIPEGPSGIPLGLGDSSDKPIELDLDNMDINMAMTDLFGDAADSEDASNASNALFGERDGAHENSGDPPSRENVLAGFQIDPTVNAGLFGDFDADGGLGKGSEANAATSIQDDSSVPSPDTLLAQLSASQLETGKTATSDDSTVSGEGFDLNSIDLSNLDTGFFGDGHTGMEFPVDMESFMSMGTSEDQKTE